MKKFLLFILVATASAQAWPFHKKPKYVGDGPTLQEQQAIEANQKCEKAKADQWNRIKVLRNELLESSPFMEIEITKKERLATGEICFSGEKPISLDEYERWLAAEVGEMKSRHAWQAILGEIRKTIFEARDEKALEVAVQRIDTLKKELSAQEGPTSWREPNFRRKKEDLNGLAQNVLTARVIVGPIEAKNKKIAQENADYEARMKLSEEERQAIYKTTGAAEQIDYLRSLSPDKKAVVERRIAEIAARTESVLYESQQKTYANLADIAASQREKENSQSLSRMASAMEKQAIAAEQAVFDSRLNSRTAPSLPSDTYSSSKVEYSRTILPSGQTISTTTWK